MIDFLSAFEDTKLTEGGRPVAVSPRFAGLLALRSGRLLATDPFRPEAPRPFVRQVTPGIYPVLLSVMKRLTGALQDEERVALLMIRFQKDVKPVTWELALREGDDARLVAPAAAYALQSASGRGALLDARAGTLLKLARDKLARQKHKLTAFHRASPSLGRYGLNVVAYHHSRFDDACAWWGLNADGEPACLVLDFEKLDGVRPPLGGDPAARRERIQALIADLKRGALDKDGITALGAYRGEAAEAVEPLLAFAAAEGERDLWSSERLRAAAASVGHICAEAPEQVARVVEALAAARSDGAAAGVLRAVYRVGSLHGEPLVPAVLRYLEPGHTEDLYSHALEAVGELAFVSHEAMPKVLALGRSLPPGIARFSVMYAMVDLIEAGAKPAPSDVLEMIDPVLPSGTTDFQEAQLSLLHRLGYELPEVEERMATLLASDDPFVQRLAVQQLQEAGAYPTRVVDKLLADLADEQRAPHHDFALELLAKYLGKDPRVESVFRQLAAQGPLMLRAQAQQTLERFDPPDRKTGTNPP